MKAVIIVRARLEVEVKERLSSSKIFERVHGRLLVARCFLDRPVASRWDQCGPLITSFVAVFGPFFPTQRRPVIQ